MCEKGVKLTHNPYTPKRIKKINENNLKCQKKTLRIWQGFTFV